MSLTNNVSCLRLLMLDQSGTSGGGHSLCYGGLIPFYLVNRGNGNQVANEDEPQEQLLTPVPHFEACSGGVESLLSCEPLPLRSRQPCPCAAAVPEYSIAVGTWFGRKDKKVGLTGEMTMSRVRCEQDVIKMKPKVVRRWHWPDETRRCCTPQGVKIVNRRR